ncbi:hypothetical protein JCM19000A_42040 [Silvimonas sp. JCM 19000]
MKPRAAAPSARINLRIGSLALPGLSVRDGQRLARALEQELSRLLATQALPTQGYARERLQLPRLSRRAHERPEHTGTRLARLIATRLFTPPAPEAEHG